MLKFLVMKIYSVTSDKQVNETVEMHDYFMKKYWPLADIIVLGYKEPEYKSDFVKFDSMGEDLGIKYQMKQIYEYFLKLDESHFIFCSDDMPVTRPIDVEVIDYTEELLKTNKIIGRVGLTSDNVRRPHTEVSRISDEVSLIENNHDAMYKLSGTWSAWNREYFLLYLKDSKDFWDWEVEGSKKSIQDDFRILSFVPPPIRISHLIKNRKFQSEWYKEAYYGTIDMFLEDQQEVKKIFKEMTIGV